MSLASPSCPISALPGIGKVSWLILFGLLGSLAANEAELAVEALLQADTARQRSEQLQRDWKKERLRLQAWCQHLQAAIEQEQQHLTQLGQDLAASQTAVQTLRINLADRAEVAPRLQALLEQVELRRQELSQDLAPEYRQPVPVDQQPVARLQAFVQALVELERASSRWQVSIREGQLADETLAVRLLQCGTVARWWSSLDDVRAGIARWQDGRLQLELVDDVGSREAIIDAIAMQEGQRLPQISQLPFGHARRIP